MFQVISFKIHISKPRNTALIWQEGTRNQENRDVTIPIPPIPILFGTGGINIGRYWYWYWY